MRLSKILQFVLLPLDFIKFLYLVLTIKIEKDEWAFLCTGHLGDTLIFCSLAQPFVEKYGGKYVLVMSKKYESLRKLWPSVSRVIIANVPSPHFTIFLFYCYNLFLEKIKFFNEFFSYKKGKINIPIALLDLPDQHFLIEYLSSLRLPLDTVLVPPKPPSSEIRKNVANKFQELGLIPGKTAILYPVARSAEKIDIIWWNAIIKRLKERGWCVATNIVDNDRPLPNTVPLRLTLEEQIPAAELAGLVIGSRSGIFDLLIFANCRKIILYNFKSLKFFKFIKFREFVIKIRKNGFFHLFNFKNPKDSNKSQQLPNIYAICHEFTFKKPHYSNSKGIIEEYNIAKFKSPTQDIINQIINQIIK